MRALSSTNTFDIFLVILISFLTGYAVFDYGLTTSAARQRFDFGLGGILIIWLIGVLSQKRVPSIPKLVWLLTIIILFLGWFSVWNAEYDHTFGEGWRKPDKFSFGLPWLPSSLNQARSLVDMIHLSVLLFGGMMISDLCRHRGNRKFLLIGFAAIGLAFALLGLFQKASNENWYFPKTNIHVWEGAKAFVSYRYHGNAATMLNYFWPISLILLLAAWVKGKGGTARTFYVCAAFFSFAALFANTSKFGQLIAPFLLILFLIFYRKTIKRLARGLPNKRLVGLILGVIALVGFGLMATLTFNVSSERWADWSGSMDVRLDLYKNCLGMLPEAGFFGIGPGVFSTAYPYYLVAANKTSAVFYHTAHQDYLQGLIEWGWFGFSIWLSLLVVVYMAGIKKVKDGSFYAAAILISILSATIQGFVDFPAQIASLQWVGICLCGILISPSQKV